MKALGKLPAAERPAVGEAANRAKSAASRARSPRGWRRSPRRALAADLARVVDVTLPRARARALGTLHPLTLVRREIEEIFARPRLRRRDRPQDRDRLAQLRRAQHAAGPPRARHAGHLLRRGRAHPALAHLAGADPHDAGAAAAGPDHRARATSSAATTTRRTRRCSRRSRGCCVDEDVTFADLKGTLLHFVQRFFGPRSWASACGPATSRSPSRGRGRRRLLPVRRQRPGDGAGLPPVQGHRLDRDRRLGHGRTPNVFRAVGYDPRRSPGFAFGMGLVAHGDAQVRRRRPRSFYEDDVRFLAQFR